MDTQIRRYKNGLFNNIAFMLLTVIIATIIFSFIGSIFGWQATYEKVNMVSGELDSYVISVENLMTKDGIRFIVGNLITNFATFTPLVYFLVATIALSIAYKSGYLSMMFSKVRKTFSRFWFTYLVSLICIVSGVAGSFGYYFLIPLAAILFLANKRRPTVGVLVSFVSLTAGSAVNVVTSLLDYNLLPYTKASAQLIDAEIVLNYGSSILFSLIGALSLAYVITYITEKIVVPMMPKYRLDDEEEELIYTKRHKKGAKAAWIGSAIILSIFLYMIIPNLPFSGILLDNSGKTYIDMLFGANSYFEDGISMTLSLTLLVSGYLYGKHAGTVKSREEFVYNLYDSVNKIGVFLVIMFLISQLIAIFRKTNLGIIILVAFMDMMKNLNFTSIPLILLLFVVVGISNLFLVSSISKWSILSPVIVPMFMKANITPEFTEVIYKVSEASSNMMTPLLPYFAIFIGYLAMYHQEGELKVTDYYKLLFPYFVGTTLLYVILIVVWYLVGLPIGINIFPTV